MKRAVLAGVLTSLSLISTPIVASESVIIRVPVTVIASADKPDVPLEFIEQGTGDIQHSIAEDKALNFVLKPTSSFPLTSLNGLAVKFNNVGYSLKVQKFGSESLITATTTVMDRCDGADKQGVVSVDRKDGVIKGFAEKKCAGKGKILTKEADIAEIEARRAEAEASIAESEAIMAENKVRRAEAEASIAESLAAISETREELLNKFQPTTEKAE